MLRLNMHEVEVYPFPAILHAAFAARAWTEVVSTIQSNQTSLPALRRLRATLAMVHDVQAHALWCSTLVIEWSIAHTPAVPPEWVPTDLDDDEYGRVVHTLIMVASAPGMDALGFVEEARSLALRVRA